MQFALRMVLIFNGSAKLQLLFNWLLGWVNSEHLPVERCSVMKTQQCMAGGQAHREFALVNKNIAGEDLERVSAEAEH